MGTTNSARSSELALIILENFIKVLSHKIRTPLSVISNDLTYFKTLIPPNECERGIVRCREISSILDKVNFVQGTDFQWDEVSTEVLAKILNVPESDQNIKGRGVCMVERTLLSKCVDIIGEYWEDILGKHQERSMLVESDKEIAFSITCRDYSGVVEVDPSTFSTFVQGCAGFSGAETLVAAMIDAILIAHEATVALEVGPLETRTIITFPVRR